MSEGTDSKKYNGTGNESVVLPKSGIADWLVLSVLALFALCLLAGLLILWHPALPARIVSLMPATPTPTKAATVPVQDRAPAPTSLPPQATATAGAAQILLQTSADRPVVLSDSFDDNKNGWEISTYDGNTFWASERIAGGKYHWNVEANHSPALDWELPKMAGVSDFAASVEARQIGGTPNGRYGMIFRWMAGQNFYLFDIADDGTFKVSQAYKENPGTALVTGKSVAIRSGEVNRLTVIGQGPHFTFFANGQYVAELEDASLTKGSVGVAVELLNQGDEVVVEFDNFEVGSP